MLKEHTELVDGFEDFVENYSISQLLVTHSAQQLDDILHGNHPSESEQEPAEPVKPPPKPIDRSINYKKWEMVDDNVNDTADIDVFALKSEAKQLMAQKKWDRAVRIYDKLILAKKEPVTYLNRALAHLSLKQVSHS